MMPVEDILKVFDNVETFGSINTPDEILSANVKHSIRLGYPQVRPEAPKLDRVILVGGGPSLEDTLPELLELYYQNAKVVTVNGAYQWCLERNIRPSAQIVLDARPENARFVDPALPFCKYLIASQCAPETWKKVEGRPYVYIWHAVAPDNPIHRPVLDEFYMSNWMPSSGGTTVMMRAILLLRAIGYLRFDMFGVDSCFMRGKHHSYSQPENDVDHPSPIGVWPTGHTEMTRIFMCAPWMIKQLECFLQTIRIHGDHFLLNVHGDGLLAFALKCGADVEYENAATSSEKE